MHTCFFSGDGLESNFFFGDDDEEDDDDDDDGDDDDDDVVLFTVFFTIVSEVLLSGGSWGVKVIGMAQHFSQFPLGSTFFRNGKT